MPKIRTIKLRYDLTLIDFDSSMKLALGKDFLKSYTPKPLAAHWLRSRSLIRLPVDNCHIIHQSQAMTKINPFHSSLGGSHNSLFK